MDALSCRCQSFCQVWYKSAIYCMRNANKCPKIPYSSMAEKTESDPESKCRSGSPPKVNHFKRVNPCPCLPSLIDVCFRVCQLSCLQNDRKNAIPQWLYNISVPAGIFIKRATNSRMCPIHYRPSCFIN